MDLKTLLEINNNLTEHYSEYLSGDQNVLFINESKYQYLIKMLLYEIDGNKKVAADCVDDPVYREFAEQNVTELTNYLAWITFLSASYPEFEEKRKITIPKAISERLFLHLLAYDSGETYVI